MNQILRRQTSRSHYGSKGNEQRFVTLLRDTFNANRITAIQAEDDFDLLIVQMAVTKSDNKEVVVFGEDTDFLVLLCHHAKQTKKAVYFTSDKHVTTKPQKIWDISNTKSVIGKDMCYLVPFIFSMTGCYTIGRLFGIGKQLALQEQAKVFMAENMSKQVIFKAGEEVIVSLYGGLPLEGLDLCRWRKFTSKTMSVSRVVSVQVQSLPPTSNTAQFHSACLSSVSVLVEQDYQRHGSNRMELDNQEGKLVPN